jgi:cytochrome oxidase Cu insertion factor (SCO1/SenC/PrrC family)
MLGLTGTPEQTDAAARAYRVYYRVNRDGDDPYYLVDHSAFSYLVLPGTWLRRILQPRRLTSRDRGNDSLLRGSSSSVLSRTTTLFCRWRGQTLHAQP